MSTIKESLGGRSLNECLPSEMLLGVLLRVGVSSGGFGDLRMMLRILEVFGEAVIVVGIVAV